MEHRRNIRRMTSRRRGMSLVYQSKVFVYLSIKKSYRKGKCTILRNVKVNSTLRIYLYKKLKVYAVLLETF